MRQSSISPAPLADPPAPSAILERVHEGQEFIGPDRAAASLREWVGDVIGRFALGGESSSLDELREAVGISLIIDARTADEVLDSRNAYLADLFCTP